jgi:hypothetical protein
MSTAIIGTAAMSTAGISTVGMSTAGMRTAAPLPASAHLATHLRLTKRGRRVLTVLAAVPVVIGALVFTLNGGIATASDVAGSTRFQYVTVAAGESLWQLAGQIAPSADPRDVISDVVHLNQLASTDLQAGQRLAIPIQYSH